MNYQHAEKNLRILVIDDNEAIHADFRKILAGGLEGGRDLSDMETSLFGDTKQGLAAERFQLDSAYQGQEGLQRVQQARAQGRPYAVAFVDVRMPPGWDGIETTGHIWREDPEVQVVICTAYSDYSWEDTVARLGQSERLLILKKPFDNVEVRQIAHALTDKWRLLRQALGRLDDMEHMVGERTSELAAANRRLQQEMADRQKIEVELRHAQKLEAVGQLAAGIAHEINTPIQFVGDSVHFLRDAFSDLSGLLSSYRDLYRHCQELSVAPELLAAVAKAVQDADVEYLEEQIPRAFERTVDGIERVATIVRAMKEFAHPSQKDKSQADLNRMIRSTLIVARNEYKYVAEVETVLADLPLVLCHTGDINQVILNLVVNAAHAISDVIKGTDNKGTIRIETRSEGETVVIAVGDTGGGIPENIRTRIFDPFFTTKEVGRGTGQGLAIARSIVVDRHGGQLSFHTEVGAGTTFFIRLPIDGKPLPALGGPKVTA